MKKRYLLILIVFIPALILTGCATASSHRKQVESDEDERITVGTVQREIRIGMSAAEVIEVLGSPNVVTTDEERREVWVYDKISSDVVYSKSEGYATLLLIGRSRSSGAESKSQRTLTIIIKYDEDNKVRDLAYHTSRY